MIMRIQISHLGLLFIHFLLFLFLNSDSDNYEVVKKIGRGKYSDVFEGVTKTGKKCVIKILKPGFNNIFE